MVTILNFGFQLKQNVLAWNGKRMEGGSVV